jgi:branched-chain amino acid transport system ATP-binding protein
MPLLRIDGLRAGYGGAPVLHGMSMVVEQGEIVSVVGANGAGKTTLLRTISGFVEPFSGEIIFEGEPIQGLAPHTIVSKGILHVLEGRQIFNFLTVEQNLLVGSSTPKAKRARDANFELVYRLFPRLAERRPQIAGTLSGGEQQMLATARALMGCPKLLMLDEPSWGLAPILTHELFQAIQTICRVAGTTVMLVEQNVRKALSMADRGYVIERGHIVMSGKGTELLGTRELKVAYLGL